VTSSPINSPQASVAERYYVLPLAEGKHIMAFSDRPDLQRFLDRLTSRSVLTEEEQQAILNLPCHAAQEKANRDFVGLGERVDHACLLVDGLIGRFDQNSEGARQITAIHIPGDMVDLHSVVQPQATSALQALSTSTILRIPHAAIRATARRYPAIAEALWRDCAVDATILSQWVMNIGRRDGKARVAHLMCEMVTRLGWHRTSEATSFVFPVTQAQLGDATGLTPVHINRVLRNLREDYVAEVRRPQIIILDWDRLVAIGDFDPRYLQTDIRPEERLRILQSI
jgi:CRP-like cAMP-binding protein